MRKEESREVKWIFEDRTSQLFSSPNSPQVIKGLKPQEGLTISNFPLFLFSLIYPFIAFKIDNFLEIHSWLLGYYIILVLLVPLEALSLPPLILLCVKCSIYRVWLKDRMDSFFLVKTPSLKIISVLKYLVITE